MTPPPPRGEPDPSRRRRRSWVGARAGAQDLLGRLDPHDLRAGELDRCLLPVAELRARRRDDLRSVAGTFIGAGATLGPGLGQARRPSSARRLFACSSAEAIFLGRLDEFFVGGRLGGALGCGTWQASGSNSGRASTAPCRRGASLILLPSAGASGAWARYRLGSAPGAPQPFAARQQVTAVSGSATSTALAAGASGDTSSPSAAFVARAGLARAARFGRARTFVDVHLRGGLDWLSRRRRPARPRRTTRMMVASRPTDTLDMWFLITSTRGCPRPGTWPQPPWRRFPSSFRDLEYALRQTMHSRNGVRSRHYLPLGPAANHPRCRRPLASPEAWSS